MQCAQPTSTFVFQNPVVWEGTGFNAQNIALACFLTFTCMAHASIGSWQGSRILDNQRFRPLVYASFARMAVILVTVLSVFFPLTIALLAPFVVWSWFPAQESWLPSGMTPAARQAYRRTLRQSVLNRSRAQKPELEEKPWKQKNNHILGHFRVFFIYGAGLYPVCIFIRLNAVIIAGAGEVSRGVAAALEGEARSCDDRSDPNAISDLNL